MVATPASCRLFWTESKYARVGRSNTPNGAARSTNPGRNGRSANHASDLRPRDCHSEPMTTLYDAAGGQPGLVTLAHAWHERVLADPVVRHAFSHGYRQLRRRELRGG